MDSEQELIDSYITAGGLLNGSSIQFLESNNSTTDMINGDFIFDLQVTVTPRAKSLTEKVAYTDKNLSSLYEEEA